MAAGLGVLLTRHRKSSVAHFVFLTAFVAWFINEVGARQRWSAPMATEGTAERSQPQPEVGGRSRFANRSLDKKKKTNVRGSWKSRHSFSTRARKIQYDKSASLNLPPGCFAEQPLHLALPWVVPGRDYKIKFTVSGVPSLQQ